MAAHATVDKFRVTAILVTHNGALWLPEVVASLTSQTRHIDLIAAIDTGSDDGSVKLLKSARIPFVSADIQTGFGQAISQVVENLPKTIDHEWIWLIHDDCALAPTALAELLIAVKDRPQVAMVGPKLLGWHDRTHLLEVGVSIAGNGARWTGLEPLEYDQGQHDGDRDVLAVSTAGALIRRDVFEELNGLDPNLTLFRDDVDFGWRVRAAGYSVIAATSAVAFHAQASASERRVVDVKGALLHRPLLLDRRNAAYVLLTNSSWWMLPWLIVQLLGTAIARALGYLIAKLPGYASDEILAIATLIIRPGLIIQARNLRRKQRFVSARVIATYIPPRWSQLRLATEHIIELFRNKVFPENVTSESSTILLSEEEEDLLTPVNKNYWIGIVKKPQVLGFLILTLIIVINSRNRFGALVGGALPISPGGASDLWRSYFQSWHEVGMGSSNAMPSWIVFFALGSLITFGNSSLFLTLYFLIAPIIMMWSALRLLKKLSRNLWICVPASLLYAISPVSLTAISAGQLATITTLILAPLVAGLLYKWEAIETINWSRIFLIASVLTILYAFTLMIFFIALISLIVISISDYEKHANNANGELYSNRLTKRVAIVFIPFIVNLPYSLESIIKPYLLLAEPGLPVPGGGVLPALLANPGEIVPIWLVSPILLILITSLFSSTFANRIAQYGIGLLVIAVITSALSISVHGNESATKVSTGPIIAFVSLAAISAGTVLLDSLRGTLILSHVHYRHYLSATLLLATIIYGLSAISWSVTKGAESLVQANRTSVIPAFFNVEIDTKILVLREIENQQDKKIQYFISRGKDISIGEPDVVAKQGKAIAEAAQGLIDGSGITSSTTLSDYGIKYLFVKSPFKKEIIQSIDGLGGFDRTSATSLGVVWQVATPTSRLVFIDQKGVKKVLEVNIPGEEIFVSEPGIIVLNENYDRSWQVLQNGKRLERFKNEQGLPSFKVLESGEILLIHDGTIRRGWLSVQLILIAVLVVMTLPSGRRKREISDRELT